MFIIISTKKEEIAINLIEIGMSIDQIKAVTGLSAETLDKLKDDPQVSNGH